MTSANIDGVQLTKNGPVAHISINRPRAKNALTTQMYADIRDSCRRVSRDESIRALVIEGVPGAFSSGGDLKELLDLLDDNDPAAIHAYEECLPYEAIRTVSQPTVAVVDGLCFGGGLTMALFCDITIATERSTFAMPEAMVGVTDGFLPRLLRDQVPPAWLRYWLYTGASFGAEEARAAGLITKVVPDGEIDAATAEVIDQLLASSSQAMGRYKRTLNERRLVPSMQDAFDSFRTDDARAGLEKFRKRAPRS